MDTSPIPDATSWRIPALLVALGSLQALAWAGWLVTRRRPSAAPRLWLALALVGVAAFLAEVAFSLAPGGLKPAWLIGLPEAGVLVLGPAVYLGLRQAVDPAFRPGFSLWTHLAPALLWLGLIGLTWLTDPAEFHREAAEALPAVPREPITWFLLTALNAWILSHLAAAWRFVREARQARPRPPQEDERLRRLQQASLACLVGAALSGAADYVTAWPWAQAVFAVGLSLLLPLLGWSLVRYENCLVAPERTDGPPRPEVAPPTAAPRAEGLVAPPEPPPGLPPPVSAEMSPRRDTASTREEADDEDPDAAEPARPPIEPDEAARLAAELRRLMEEDKLYRDPLLSLDSLCRALKVRRQVASHLLATEFAGNFYQIVNRYRVEAAARRLRDPAERDKTVAEIAYDVGYNSLSSFNSAFRRHLGATPKEVRAGSSEAAPT